MAAPWGNAWSRVVKLLKGTATELLLVGVLVACIRACAIGAENAELLKKLLGATARLAAPEAVYEDPTVAPGRLSWKWVTLPLPDDTAETLKARHIQQALDYAASIDAARRK